MEYMKYSVTTQEEAAAQRVAVEDGKAVEDCISERILAEFLIAQRAEVVAMSIFEYDAEKHLRLEKEESYEEGREAGREEGREEGLKEGSNRMLLLLRHMEQNDEIHLINKLQDAEFLEQMYAKYQV